MRVLKNEIGLEEMNLPHRLSKRPAPFVRRAHFSLLKQAKSQQIYSMTAGRGATGVFASRRLFGKVGAHARRPLYAALKMIYEDYSHSTWPMDVLVSFSFS